MSSENFNAGAGEENNSLMDNLKGAGEAWLAAGSALGGVVSGFAKNFRQDRSTFDAPGAHAVDPDVAGTDSVAQQLRAAVENARDALNSADNDKDFRAAAGSFATDAESIVRDLVGSLSRAGDATVESGQADQLRARLQTALGEVRETFNSAVADVRSKASESDVDVDSTVNDLRARLDALIAKISAQFTLAHGDSKVGDNQSADIIDGEVVETDNTETT